MLYMILIKFKHLKVSDYNKISSTALNNSLNNGK
jgi:hypothetical protein